MAHKKSMKKEIIGLTEDVIVFSPRGSKKKVRARIDTGATKSSVDAILAAQLTLGPIIKTKLVKSATGNTLRPLIKVKIKLKSKIIVSEFSIADRTQMKYKVLIGQNVLKHGYLIDATKK